MNTNLLFLYHCHDNLVAILLYSLLNLTSELMPEESPLGLENY